MVFSGLVYSLRDMILRALALNSKLRCADRELVNILGAGPKLSNLVFVSPPPQEGWILQRASIVQKQRASNLQTGHEEVIHHPAPVMNERPSSGTIIMKKQSRCGVVEKDIVRLDVCTNHQFFLGLQ